MSKDKNQKKLFNVDMMTSHRTLARLARARALSTYKSGIAAQNLSAVTVTDLDGKPMPASTSSRDKSICHLNNRSEKPRRKSFTIPDPELHYPDESRTHTVYCGKCPECGYSGQHVMRISHHAEQPKFRIQALYSIQCGMAASFRVHLDGTRANFCHYETPWLKSSALALQHWKVTSALSQ